MRTAHFVLLMAFLTLLSCYSVRFDSPQPADAVHLSEFPEALKGTYLAYDYTDTAYLHPDTLKIREHAYLRQNLITERTSLKEFEGQSKYYLQDNKVFLTKNTNFKGQNYNIHDDTISFQFNLYDTVNLSVNLKLLQLDSLYYLNYAELGGWEVIRLSPLDTSDWLVAIFMINGDDDPTTIEEYKQMTNFTEIYDSVQTIQYYWVNPAGNEFFKLAESDLPKPVLVLKKVKK